MKSSEAYSVRAVERAADVLDALAQSDRPQTLSSIAERAKLSLPTTFRLVRTLQQQGLVMPATEDGRFVLGFRVLELANALMRQLDIVGIARPLLNAIRDEVNETVSLAVRSGDYHVHAAQAEAAHPLRRVLDIGERVPLYAGCSGKLFLAAAADAEIEHYLTRTELLPLSDTTPTDPELLREQIALVRSRGFAESVNERGFGGAGIAAPVRAHDGRVVAALEIAGPITRFTPYAREQWIAFAMSNAAELSRSLGFRPDSDAEGAARTARRREEGSDVISVSLAGPV